ncbi:MAG: GNAT family N-acetyltransferase [Patescibacteria group bacterium]|nr:GNAT family N-acetyltransferase [Patescibacteria group bacterium]
MKIKLKKADFSDIEFLWHLRNSQPEVFRFFQTNRVIEWQEHVSWIMPIILGLNEKRLFVVCQNKTPIGQVRFDAKENQQAVVSIAILKEFQGRGVGKAALKLLIKQTKKAGMKTLLAEIHQENIASQKLFEKLGFALKGQDGVWGKYYLVI